MIIPVNVVENKKITSTKTKNAGNIGENEVTTLAFTFSEDWTGTTKVIVIKTPAGVLKLPASLETDDTFPINGTLFDAVGTMNYTVYGSYGDGRVINASGEILVGDALANTGGLTVTEFTDIITSCQQATQAAIDATETVNAAIPAATEAATTVATEQAGIATTKAAEASASAVQAQNNILNGVSTHNSDESSHSDIRADIRSVEAIARGRATAFVFDTLEAMNTWLAVPENVATLVVGDNLFIRALNVKDRWWDGTSVQLLETECPDLTNYYLKTEVDAMMPIPKTVSEYQALADAGTIIADRFYFVGG